MTVKTSIPVCSACRQKDSDNLLKAQAFYKEHPDASMSMIAAETGIPVKIINWYFQNGKLGNARPRDVNAGKDRNSISITEELYGNYIWVQVTGKIDSANATIFQRHIDRLINDQWTNIIVDMSSVTFLCSTGIRVILTAYKTLHELNGSFHIANPSKNVENVLGMVALDTLLLS